MSTRQPSVCVDAHVHLSRWWRDLRRTAYRPDLDYSVEGLLREMDRAGVDYALAIQLFEAPTPQALAEGRAAFAASGGRLVAVATVDPLRGAGAVRAAVTQLEKERSVVAIKLFPGYRPFYPHDRRLDPVYEAAARRRLPVLVHQGDTLDGQGLVKFARPLEIDEVAARFREVRFVLCHLGNPWIDEAAEMIYKNSNVFADTSGLLGPPGAPYFDRSVALVARRVHDAIVSTGLPERFLYGSDWPLEELSTAVSLVRRLRLSAEHRDAILGGNAQKLFGLPVRPLDSRTSRVPRTGRRRRARTP